jgi:hypothetical protein
MWRAVFKFWALRLLGVAALAVFMAAVARADTATSFTAGVDVWHLPAKPARYLPNYATPHPWRTDNPWVEASIRHRIDTDLGTLTLTASGHTSGTNAGRVDRLDADLNMGRYGARLGVLPYRVSWCRGRTGAWIAEPDAFCRFAGLNEISEGAFGAQAYISGMWRGWLLDGMAGVYRPMVDGQSDKLGPYVAVGPNVRHHAHGASVNAMHLATGAQARLGWLSTSQDQDSASGGYQRRLRYDTLYLAGEGNLAPGLDVRASLAAYVGNQVNPARPYAWDGRSLTIEAAYKPTHGHTVSAGLSRYTNVTTYATGPNNQRLMVPSASLAWRVDLPGDAHAVLQATRSLDDATTRAGVQTRRDGTAYGLRLGRVF